MDISSFGKYEVRGAKAAAALDRVLAGLLPSVGRIRLTPMLSPSGRLMGDLTTARLSEDRFLVFGSGYLQTWHMRWFQRHLPSDDVSVRNVSDELVGLAIFGPRSRELLSRLTGQDIGNNAFPFMSVKTLDVGLVPAVIGRLSVTGELGYEIYVDSAYLWSLYEALHGAGEDLGLRDVGMYALNSLRLEKGYGIWSREFSQDYTPAMSGMSRFIAYDKEDFIGRDAALRDHKEVPSKRLALLEIAAEDADAAGYEPIWRGRKMVGFVTSGGYGHSVGKSLAMGYLDTELIDADVPLEMSIVGERRSCRVLRDPAVDPRGLKVRL